MLKEAAAAETERLNAELASTNEVIFVNKALTSAYDSPLNKMEALKEAAAAES